MSEKRGWRRFAPAFSLRTLLEVVFVCAVLFYIWVYRPPSNIIQPGHLLHIDSEGTLMSSSPLRGHYVVDPDGNVNLGAAYGPAGKVRVAGMTADDAQRTILTELSKILARPQVTVSIVGWQDKTETSLSARVRQLEDDVARLRQQIDSEAKR